MDIAQLSYINKMKKKYYTVATVPKSNRKVSERGKIDNPNTYIYMAVHLTWFGAIHFNNKFRG